MHVLFATAISEIDLILYFLKHIISANWQNGPFKPSPFVNHSETGNVQKFGSLTQGVMV